MKRTLLAVVAALVTWVLLISLLNFALRYVIAGYAAAEPTFAFTLSMQLARLAIAAATSLAAGMVAAGIAPRDSRAPSITGALLLVLFLPTHVKLWANFPLWYHLTFLVTLVPLVVLGARCLPADSPAPPPAPGAPP
ncbi:MAG TPA: hypothetical protein VGI91_12065 [Steroidobacteraceae bacterium]|jgi:hypothetical protein